MTPLAIEMLMWFHTRAAAAGPFPNIGNGPQLEIVNWFLDEEVITTHADDGSAPYIYRTTEKGDALVNMILATPMPKQVWIDPRPVRLPAPPLPSKENQE